MPAINTDSGARAAQPKKKIKKKRPAPTVPDQADRTRQQTQQGRAPASRATGRAPEEQQYLSEAHSVRIRAGRQKREAGTSPSGDRPQNRARQMTSPAVQEGVKRARLRVKAKQGRGAGVRAATAAPKMAAGGLAKLGDIAAENIRQHGPQVMGGGNANVVQQSNLPATKLAENLAKDAATFPSQAITSTYDVTAGIKEAAAGHPSRLKRIAKDFDASDPVWNAALAGAAAATGDSATAKRRLRVAKTTAQEHPGLTALELVGAKGTIGRGAGATMRSGALGGAAKRAASTERASKTLEGTNVTVPREYSRDVFAKAGQVLSDKTATGKRKTTRENVTVQDLNKRVDERVSVSGTDHEPFVAEFGATKSGKVQAFPTRVGAARRAQTLTADSGIEFVPVPYGTAHAVVPKAALERLAEHGDVKPKTAAGRSLSLANDVFRKTVLSTSTSWAAGNVIEAGIRGALNKTGPRSYVQGVKVKRALNRMDPTKAEELAARVTGGGHYSLADKNSIKDVAQHFSGTAVEPMAQALHNFWRHPVPKATAGVWRTWNTAVFHGMRKVEEQFQTAQLGAAVRRSNLMDGKLFKLSNSAVEEAANGLRNTETQVRFARQVERAYGKYQGFSPSTKMLIAHYSPFIAWFLNAAKFVGDVLPRDHPTATAVIAAAEMATEDWRKDHGLDLWMQGAVPGWLQGSIPSPGGGKIRASRFTPFGAFGDLPDTLSSQVLPLYSGPLLALKGLAWNGQPLNRQKKGEPAKTEGEQQVNNAMTAIGEFLDATIPVISQAKRINDKGAKALNPFEPVKPKATPKKIRKISAPGRVDLGGLGTGRVKLGGDVNGRVKLN